MTTETAWSITRDDLGYRVTRNGITADHPLCCNRVYTPEDADQWLAHAQAQEQTTPRRRGIIKSASAHMPAACKSPYRRVALIVVSDDVKTCADVKMISKRARGVVDIVACGERLAVGKCVRSAFAVAARDLRALAIAEAIDVVDDDTIGMVLP